MKILSTICALVLICNTTLAQEQGDNVCYKGTFINGDLVKGDPLNETCVFSLGNSCQTKFIVGDGNTQIYKSCKQTQACQSNAVSNRESCYGDSNVRAGNRVCYFCCEEPHCNNFNEIPARGEDPVPFSGTQKEDGYSGSRGGKK